MHGENGQELEQFMIMSMDQSRTSRLQMQVLPCLLNESVKLVTAAQYFKYTHHAVTIIAASLTLNMQMLYTYINIILTLTVI